ncbi:MFS transporter [Maricaulis sp. D1M11]|uniref:MFS transporter n=1 Tax=Maricaulis sp. D1M11 TaxID=3076117 RepID=UPI0039B3BA97
MSARLAAGLVTQARFLPLMIAQSLGAFNDNFFRYALITLVTYKELSLLGASSEVIVPLAASLFTGAILLFSAIAGRLADKYDRTRLMRVAKFAEIWLMAIVAIAFVLELPLLLMPALFLMGVQSAFFSPAKQAALPTLLKPEELVPANALLSGTLNVSVLLGIGIGSWLIQRAGGELYVGAVLIIMAILGWLSIRQLPPARASEPDAPVSFNFIWETVRVLRFAVQHPDVLRPLLGAAWFWMLAAAVITLMPNFTKNVLGADESVFLLFSVLFTIGAAIGALLCGVISGKGEALWISCLGALGLVVFNTDIALASLGRAPTGETLTHAADFLADRGNWRLLFDLGFAAISAGLFVVPLQALAQRRARPDLRGRLLAAGGLMNAGTATIGNFMLAGLAFAGLPIQFAFFVLAAVSLFAAGFIAWRMKRKTSASHSAS